ncbi:MAG: hypothetical protein KBH01_07220 [Breznakibacter sp.]|nr:hypothetical protein [Breznakibacter sp.]
MKKIVLLLAILFSVSAVNVSAQCGEELLKQALKEMGNSQYIKDFEINLTKDKKDMKTGYVKFSVVLNSRSHYQFNVVNGSGNVDPVVMQLYDADKLIVSNFEGGKFYTSFQFICRTTKIYTLQFFFKNGDEGCARSVLSLVKQYAEGEMK